jgi:hypothetical protein
MDFAKKPLFQCNASFLALLLRATPVIRVTLRMANRPIWTTVTHFSITITFKFTACPDFHVDPTRQFALDWQDVARKSKKLSTQEWSIYTV